MVDGPQDEPGEPLVAQAERRGRRDAVLGVDDGVVAGDRAESRRERVRRLEDAILERGRPGGRGDQRVGEFRGPREPRPRTTEGEEVDRVVEAVEFLAEAHRVDRAPARSGRVGHERDRRRVDHGSTSATSGRRDAMAAAISAARAPVGATRHPAAAIASH